MRHAAVGSPVASRASGRRRVARYPGWASDHDPDLGHVLDRVAQALAAEAGILDAAVGHVVDPVGRDVVDDDAAHLELGERSPGAGQVVGEDAGLQAEHRVVDARDRVVEVAEREGDDERGERLVRADLGGRPGRRSGRSAEVGAVRLPADADDAAERHRLVDPALRPGGRGGIDHRPEIGRGIERIAHPERSDALDEAGQERSPRRPRGRTSAGR